VRVSTRLPAIDSYIARSAPFAQPILTHLRDSIHNAVPDASAQFAKMSPSCRREYIDWIADARREETRSKRLATALEWIAEGKSRNWKYEQPA
jgi:uncharacterized protein YdeI (YjbR/CyaY-like superfamily)